MKYKLETKRAKVSNLHVSANATEIFDSVFSEYSSDSCMLVMDENVQKLHPWLHEIVARHFDKVVLADIASGESSKSVENWSRLTDIALNNKLRRGAPLIALGGGVAGDLSGFVASSVLRGLPLIHVPTTLLAMVDSSIGGKTGINHPSGKNLIGAFYQPDHIIMDLRFLETLPTREWNCGYGEVIKYACISDSSIFSDLEKLNESSDATLLQELVYRCAQIKADIVIADELESGIRAHLNYGHTFAHALEAFTSFSRFAHGEAVFVGLIAATWLSEKLGANVNPDRIIAFRNAFNLRTKDLSENIDELVSAMFSDKKISSDKLKLVILKSWENVDLIEISDLDVIKEAWKFALENAHGHDVQ